MHKIMIRAPQGDALEYIMSDASTDRYGDVVEPTGWDLKNFKNNPVALFGHDAKFIVGKWTNVRVENNELRGKLELLPPGTSERLDEIRAAVEAGVLRAVSVGFRPLKSEPTPDGKGYRFTKSELMECSLVSIPANPNALQVARSLNLSDEAIETVFGESADEMAILQRTLPGEQAVQKTIQPSAEPRAKRPEKAKTMNLAERIQDSEQQINRFRDQLTETLNKSADGVMSDDAVILMDEINAKIESLTKSRDALKRAETAMAIKSDPAIAAPAVNRRPLSMKKDTNPADYIVRAAVVSALAFSQRKGFDQVLAERYPDDEQTGIIAKAAVAGATTSATGWAAELVNTATDAFLATLTPASVYPALAGAGVKMTFNNQQGAIRIPSRATTPSIAGSFVGEGAPIPVRRLGLQSFTLTPRKMGVISVFSRELEMYSTPAIEQLIRQEIINDTSMTLDSLLLDSTASSTVRPAGLLNGVTPLTATSGGGAAAILGDIAKLAAPFDTANAGRNLVLLMNPAQARAMAMTAGPDGSFGWTDRFTGEFKIITSTNVPAGRLVMLDATDFVTATGDTPQFDVSDQTVLHMEDTTPLQIGTAGAPATVAAPAQSMFQTAQIAVRMLLDVTWAMRRTGMVQTIATTSW